MTEHQLPTEIPELKGKTILSAFVTHDESELHIFLEGGEVVKFYASLTSDYGGDPIIVQDN